MSQKELIQFEYKAEQYIDFSRLRETNVLSLCFDIDAPCYLWIEVLGDNMALKSITAVEHRDEKD